MSTTQQLVATDVHYRSITIDGVEIFYREAGRPDAPTIVLLHGWPSSSHMFRDLLPKLADRFHLVAPDYPGFGFSAAPSPASFAYTFDNLANVVEKFIDTLGIGIFSLYVQDYGGPIGFRIAARNPERIRAIVVQNANIHMEGISEALAPLANYWSDQSTAAVHAVRGFLAPQTTKFQYTHGASDVTKVSPDAWTLDQALLDRPGNDAIQLALLLDYRTNVPLFTEWQRYVRTYTPPMLIVSGKNDPFFLPAGAEALAAINPNASLELVDGGHFALEEHSAEIARRMHQLADRVQSGVYAK